MGPTCLSKHTVTAATNRPEEDKVPDNPLVEFNHLFLT